MLTKFIAAAGLVLAFAQAPATATDRSADEIGRAAAIQACMAANERGAVELIEAVEDGMGDWLVWLRDSDTNLWACNADEKGAVYASLAMQGDLLKGRGASLVSHESRSRSRRADAAEEAAGLCQAVGEAIEAVDVVATVEDGLGDYLVWLQNDEEELWMCNASGAGELFVFEPVDYQINEVPEEVETRTA